MERRVGLDLLEQLLVGHVQAHLPRFGKQQLAVDQVLHRDVGEVELAAQFLVLLPVQRAVALLGATQLLEEVVLADGDRAHLGGDTAQARP